MRPKRRQWIVSTKIALLIVLITVVFVVHFRYNAFAFLNPDNIDEVLESLGPSAPLVFIPIMALAIIISPIPGIPLAASAGMFFGPFLGGIYSLIGGYTGSAISFLLARHLGRDIIERLVGKPIRFYPKGKTAVLTRIVFVSRLIPFISFDIVSYGAGFTRIPFLRYSIATILGMIPFTFVYTYFGSLLFVQTWVTIIVGMLFLVAFLSLPVLIRSYNVFGLRDYWFDGGDEQDNADSTDNG